MGVIIVAGLGGMRLALGAFTAIVALYAKHVLDLTGQTRGWYFGLLKAPRSKLRGYQKEVDSELSEVTKQASGNHTRRD